MSGLSNSVEDATSKFSMLENIAVGAHNIGAKLTRQWSESSKAFTIRRAMDGFKSMNYESTRFKLFYRRLQSKGTTLQDVNKNTG